MKTRFYGLLAMVLCAMLAFAAGGTKQTEQARKVAPKDPPSVAMDRTVFTPWKSTAMGTAVSVGTYTTLEGWYDYQGNGVTQQIRADSATGRIHAIMMIAEDSSAPSASRRTAYALSTNDGGSWNNFSNVRIPNGIRSGFGSIDLLRGPVSPGAPLVANHNVGGGTDISSFVYIGDNTGLFTELAPTPLLGTLDGGEPIWPFIVSGAGGELVMQSSNTSTPDPDHENYITRSTDYGASWSSWLQVPVTEGSGGRYPMIHNGANRIGTVVPGDSTFLIESTDNGATWLPRVLVYPKLRGAGAETLGVYTGGDLVYRGNEPMVSLTTAVSADGDFFTTSTARIEFWSPSTGVVTAVEPDSLLFASSTGTQTNHLIMGYPSMAMSGSAIVIAFQAFLADPATIDTLVARPHGEIFLTQSTDNGATWTLPVNLTKTKQVDERYPSISRWNPAGYVYVVWQEDAHPGSYSVAEPDHNVKSLAKQVFYKVDLNSVFPANDITALAVSTPDLENAILEGTTFAPKASFRNIGLVAQTSIPVKFEILNSSQAVVYTNTQTIASLAPAAITEVTFATVPGTLTPGLYTSRALAANPGDLQPTNDTTNGALVVIPSVTVTANYFENFEDSAPEVGGIGWHAGVLGGGTLSDWVRGTPAKTQIANAWSGTKCFVTKTAGNYSDDRETYLGSPSFNLSSFTGNVRVEFYQNFVFEPNWDGGWLEYSTNGGTTWNVADHVFGSGPTFNTAMSTGWYNAVVDSGQEPGAPAPPYWSDSTVLYTNTNGWIKSTTMIPVGGYTDVRLRWHLSADANQNREGWAIDDFTLKVGNCSVTVTYTAGWNMISNPVQKPAGQDSVSLLYPGSAFNYVFGFGTGGYYQTRTMANGPGYWGKFNAGGSVNITGGCILSLSAPVNLGWNMIGSMTASVDTSNVYPAPYGSRASVYFGYSGGYNAVATLEPGKAYWVKASAPGGFLYLPPAPGAPAAKSTASPLAQLNALTVKDAAGRSTTLYFGGAEEGQVDVAMYEMPPVPPAGAFDARFSAAGGKTAEAGYMVQVHEIGATQGEFPVRLQSAVYPVTVSWNVVSDAGYRLTDGMGSKAFSAKELRGTGSVVIRNAAVSRLAIGIGGEALPTEYALLQNYPNPFNPSTTIKFALPEAGKVTVEIYNLLGQRVSTLLNDQMEAGYHEVKWNGTAATGQVVGSGIYFARFSARGVEGRTFTDVRKLMLMK